MTREEAITELNTFKIVAMSELGKKALDKAINALEQEPKLRQALEMEKGAYNALVKNIQCSDCISRQAAIDACLNGWNKDYKEIVEEIRALPPVKSQYTDAEIQKMQDLEFAEIQKAYEIGKADGSKEHTNAVLDKIRTEIDSHCSDNRDRNDGLYIAMRIIDKYKASPTGAESEGKTNADYN